MIELDNVSKRYGSFTALHPMSFSVTSARTTVLIGPSGCGKSTLLRLTIGLLQPDTGSVRFEGTPVRPDNVLELRHRMGYVIQEGGLFPHLDARNNVTFMARHLGWSRERIERRLAELTELVRLPTEFLDRFPLQLSGGQRQRVSLMRALMLDPDLLLLDEPLAALDPLIRVDLQDDLKEIFRTLGKTVLLVTHDLAEADFFGDDVILLNEGKIVQRGSLASLVREPTDPFVTRFVRAQRGVTLEGGAS
jgi:osmoprotectant transport system ATP-binding protein